MRTHLPTLLLALFCGCDWISDDDFRAQLDPDGDGIDAGLDCDDSDPTVLVAPIWYRDADGDGEGDAQVPFVDPEDPGAASPCEQPEGYVANSEDCDDSDDRIGADTVWWQDNDGDSYGDWQAKTFEGCSPPSETAWVPGVLGAPRDCNDNDRSIHPEAAEVCEPGVERNEQVDNNCDGDPADGIAADFVAYFRDGDGDGYGDDDTLVEYCDAPPSEAVPLPGDCDDSDPDIHPGIPDETADGTDQNCDGIDGFGDLDDDGYTAEVDCDDSDPSVYPGAPDPIGDGINADCDPLDVDGVDADGDGVAAYDIDLDFGFDCDDTNPQIYGGPSAPPERCDTVDWNCDGSTQPSEPMVSALDETGTAISAVTAIANLPEQATALGVCGTVLDFALELPERDFEILGFPDSPLGPSKLCPDGDIPLLSTPANAAYAGRTISLTDLAIDGSACPVTPLAAPLIDLSSTTGGQVFLTDMSIRNLDTSESSSPVVRIAALDTDIDSLGIRNVRVSTGIQITNGDTVARGVSIADSSLGSAGLNVVQTDGSSRLDLIYPSSERNTGEGVVFSSFAPTSIVHAPQTYSVPTLCVGPSGGGIIIGPTGLTVQAPAGPEHVDNDIPVFQMRNDFSVEAGIFSGNKLGAFLLETPLEDAVAEFRELTFTRNQGEIGSAIRIANAGQLDPRWTATITSSLFHANTATGRGGAIYSGAPSSIVSQLNTFCQNQAPEGGAVYLGNEAIFSSTDDEFEQNAAVTAGGAFRISGGAAVLTNSWLGRNNSGEGTMAMLTGGSFSGYNVQTEDNHRSEARDVGISLSGGATMTLTRIVYWLEPFATILADETCFEIPVTDPAAVNANFAYVFCAASTGECTSDNPLVKVCAE
jgi:predicted outer membrane repeat protein